MGYSLFGKILVLQIREIGSIPINSITGELLITRFIYSNYTLMAIQ